MIAANEPDTPHAPQRAWPGLFPWQGAAAAAMLADRARWPHALMLAGQGGIGKRALALEFARALLCETPRPGGAACGECASCGYVAAGQHPDLRVVAPSVTDDEGVAKPVEWIQVEAIRSLIVWAQLTSHRRVAKVAVIAPAERMNAAAANALLKTLEEPAPSTYLILVSDTPGRLPATLRSRCRTMQAPRPDAATARAWLAGEGIADADALLAQAAGAPLAARLLADPAYQAERAAWLKALATPSTLVPARLAARIDAAPREERRDRLAQALDWLTGWCADLAHAAAGAAPRRNGDHAAALLRLAPSVAPIPLIRYHRTLQRQRGLVAHPLTPRLVAEALLIDYRNLFH
ncbi:MAG: DNA polymerase III subunit delta' [Casimicrobiaceae bacterium]